MCIYIREFMGRMQIVLSDGTEKKLRELIGRKIGAKKGAISDVTEEALKEWIKKNG